MTSPLLRRVARLVISGALALAMLAATVGIAPSSALAASTITQWNFNSVPVDASAATGSTAPSVGSGTAALLAGNTATFASGTGSTDPAASDNSGWNLAAFAAQGTGNETRGAQFNVSTAGQQNIVVSWDQRHSNTSSRYVRFQYSTDGTTFTNFGNLFEANPGDTWYNNRSVDLSSVPAVNNNPNFAFRIVAAFAPGTSTYVAATSASAYGTTGTWRFDQVAVSGDSYAPPTTPTVKVSVSTDVASEAAQTVVTVSAVASAAVSGDQTVSLAVSGTGITPSDYTLSGTIITIPSGATQGSVTFTVIDDTDVEGSETANFTISNPSAGITLSSDTTRSTTIADNDSAAPTITKISAVQGNSAASPLAGLTVTVDAIVVGDYQGQNNTELRGFFLQEEDADADADPATSEGIFVFCATCDTAVSVGDRVQVTGSVSEFFNMTQITSSAVTVLSSNNPLPTPASLTLPVPGVTGTTPATATPQINAYFEQFEGMLVRFPDTLSVAEYFELARYGQIVLSQGGRPRQLTDTDAPSTSGYAQHLVDLARTNIILDDLNNTQNFAITGSDTPYFWPRPGMSTTNYLRGGDTIANLTGVLHWSFAGQSGTDAWRIRPVEPAFSYAFTRANPRPAPPVLPGLKVGAYNVLNYFLTPDTTASSSSGPCGPSATLDCRGPDSAAESVRQRAKLTQALKALNADALGLIELENTTGVDPLAQIVSDLNAVTAPGTYSYINTGTIGGDAIRVGIIYKSSTLLPSGAFKTLDKTIDPRFNSDIMRPSLAQTFVVKANGAKFTLVVNHLKSKGSCPTDATSPDADQLDGQGCWNATRASAAAAVADWIKTDPTASGDPDFLVVGDMNAYRKEDPITAFKNGGLVDLIDTRIGAGAYSYLFSAQLGYLDHALATPSLAAQVGGVDEWHINADESDLLDYNDTVRDVPGESTFERKSAALPLYEESPYRTSDHDPVIVGLNLTVANTPPALAAIATYNTGLGGNGAEIVSVRGNRAVVSNAPDGSVDIVDVSDLLAPKLVQRVKLPELVGLTSVAIHPTKDLFVAVAGESTPTSRYGRLLAFRLSDGALLAQATIAPAASSPNGRQPDSVEFSPDGRYAVIAVEAQQVNATDDGGAGAIGVADVSAFDPATSTSITVSTVELPDLTGLAGATTNRGYDTDLTPRTAVVNTPGGLEPEGIAFAADSSAVYVTLQENNAIVRLDLAGTLPATLPAANAFGLGQTSHIADVTTGDGYNPTGSITLFREPDGVRAVEIGGTRYLLTADEGDTRNAALSSDVRGGRTLSIFNAATGAVVADTGNQLDELANRYGIYPDARSNRGGAEPEMLDVAAFGGRVIAAVGLERANAVAFVDVTDPTLPLAFGLVRTGNAPEGVKLVQRAGVLYVLTADEASGTVTIATVPVAPLNATVAYTEDTPRTFGIGAIDRNGDTLTVDLALSPASAGTLSGAGLTSLGNGQYRVTGSTAAVNAALLSLTFTPAPNVNGTATLAISASDGVNPATAGTITLAGTAVNDAPTAANDTATTAEDTPVAIDVLANDSDVDGNTLIITAVSAPANGTASIISGKVVYTPTLNFNGADSFTYTISDGNGGTATATVDVTVTPVNDAPTIAVAAGGVCLADFRGQVSLGIGDVETAAGSLTLSATSSNTNLVPVSNVSFGGSGASRTATIATVAGRSGSAVVTITVSDGIATATTTVTVIAGTSSDETLNGTAGADILFAGNGQDVLNGNDGIDLLCAGGGDDKLYGGQGADTLDGGQGQDLLDGGQGDDSLLGGQGDDQLMGGDGNDTLSGGNGNDRLDGGAGNDKLFGEAGDDRLTGGTGADSFDGGSNNDQAIDFNAQEGDTKVNIP